MRDFLPSDKARRESVLSVIRARYRAHGFDEIETPVMEEHDRLHAGIGGDNEKLAFNVLKRGLDAETVRAGEASVSDLSDLGLRYDLTVPLARFYASNRGHLPGVFRSIQIGPVWRAERPQKGRFRQFVQCDIDIIGDATYRAEAELITATLDTLDHLGLSGATVRVNDRRLLDWMLDSFGFAASERSGVLITLDKLDKIGATGVIAELRDREADEAAVSGLEAYLTRVEGIELGTDFREEALRELLPANGPDEVIASLLAIGSAVSGARGGQEILVFDPFLVRGMGYYTGTIFELAHPSVSYSLGGGGRYDGMIGRFTGGDVPAVGFSIGFERIVDLIELVDEEGTGAIVIVHDRDVPVDELIAAKALFVGNGTRVRLEQRTKNLKGLLDRAQGDGYTAYATLSAGQSAGDLDVRSLSA